MKIDLEELSKLLTRELYNQESQGLEMSHFSELGWRLSLVVKKYLENDNLSQPTPEE